jgi:hypothetical protein
MRRWHSDLINLGVPAVMPRPNLRHFLLAVAAAAAALTAVPAMADTLRWPPATSLPKPASPPAAPPAVLERPASAYLTRASAPRTKSDATCQAGQVCVICVAACDSETPRVVQNLKPRSTGEPGLSGIENNSDGIADNAPRFARQEWAGITCGYESGCRVSGVLAPRSRSYDVRFTIIRPTVGGASSWYIDGP